MSKALATKNVAAVLLGIGMILSVFAFATPAKADVVSDLQAQINALLAQISALQTSGSSSSSCSFTFTANLKQGSTGTEVMNLQKFLNKSADTQVSATGAGSPGNETSTFGPATKKAVIKFQEKYAADVLTPNGLTSGTGNWFASTRAKANALCSTGGSTGGSTGTTPGTLSVFAGSQPANSLAPQNVARVPFTTFTLTNSSNAAVTINGITVQRTGLGVNAVFAGVVLMDSNGSQLGLAKTLNSNNQAIVGDTFTIGAGQSMTLTVAGNMAASLSAYSGQVVGIQVVGVNTTATVSGSLPISGASHTINSTLSVGAVSTSTSAFDPGVAQSKNIGDTDVRFAGIRFQANSVEDIRLFSIRWRQTGSASSIDMSNVMTVVNGTSYPTTVDASGRYYTTVFAGGILIPKGQSIDAYIKGDITGSNAASRTVVFGIDRNTDVYFVGQTFGYGIAVSGTGSPWFAGYTITINPGSASTIGRATEVGSQNIAVNVSGQPLGAFATDFMGEPVSVQTMTMTIATTSNDLGSNPLITDISIVDSNGTTVAGPVDATWVSGVMTVVFNDTVTFPIGRKVYTLKGKIPSTANTGATVQVSVNPTNWTNVVGQTSGSTITLGVTTFTLSQMTVQGANLTIAMSAQPASATIAANQSGYTFSTIQLDASQSGEDIRVNAVKLRIANNTGLTGCQVFDGANAVTTGSNVLNTISTGADNSFTFNNPVVVTKGSVKNLSLKCNLSNGSGTYTWTLAATTQSSATGVTSGNSVTPTNSANAGGAMTVGTPSVVLTVAPGSPAYTLAAANTTGVTIGSFNLRAANEAMTLNRLGVTIGSGSVDGVSQVYIYDGASQVGTVTFVGTTATSSLMNVALLADTDKVLTLKADLAPITTGNAGTVEGMLLKINPSAVEVNSPSSGTITAAGSGTVNGVRIYKTFPTIAQDTMGVSGATDGKLLRFKVTADAKGPVGIGKFTFKVATSSTITVSDVGLYVLDAGNSPVSQTGATAANGLVGSSLTGIPTNVNFSISPTTNQIQVPAGTTYTFELRASTVSTSNTTYSVTSRVVADTTQGTAIAPFSSFSASTTIWSANATTTAGLTTGNDWANGYGISGFSSDLIQNRTQ